MIEAIPTWNEGESVELYKAIYTSEFDFESIKSEIEAKMREVRDRGYAKAPETKPAETKAPETSAPAVEDEGGCGGTVTVMGIALVAALGTCAVVVSKKED